MLQRLHDMLCGPPRADASPPDYPTGVCEALREMEGVTPRLREEWSYSTPVIEVERFGETGLVLLDNWYEKGELTGVALVFSGFFDFVRDLRAESLHIHAVLLVTPRRMDSQDVLRLWVNNRISVVSPVRPDQRALMHGLPQRGVASDVSKALDYALLHRDKVTDD